MKFSIRCLLGVMLVGMFDLQAQPLIRSIDNKTPFQFIIVGHNDMSDCSPLHTGKSIIIQPHSQFKDQLLLGFEKPGLRLRPSAFYDEHNKILYEFLDEHQQVDPYKLAQAFHAWKNIYNKKYKKDVDTWYAQWLCGDISLIHNHMEIFGYLLNISIARVDNKYNTHACTVDYSEGLFSRQVIDITINQKSKKGIMPHVKSFVGQGGICHDGKIVSIS